MRRKTVTLTALMIGMMLTIGISSVNAAPFPNLPPGLVTLQVADDTNSYFISTLSAVPAGYDVADGSYPGWCVDMRTDIPREEDILVTLYSSLTPPLDLASERWDMVNYILNNKEGLEMMDIQRAIWYFVKMDGVGWWNGSPGAGAQAIVDDAEANGDGFIPGEGEILAIICMPETETQITIIEIEIPDIPCGLSPGFWKHNIRVALNFPGRYSVPHDGEPRIDYDIISGYADSIGVTLEQALEALTAKGPGSDIIRLEMANAFNAAAGYEPYSD
ncbi:MAG: hypothetical protein AC479_05560 [miscellaneous Crenarchaeota group-6 archaeon AD8-1]|nr:MAG: hypothetical protein AC479_05560 [miscellaneous Crenarchaeota group-6 archaeon AD8-1]